MSAATTIEPTSAEVFGSAGIVAIDGDSYRLREAEERQKVRATARRTRKERPPR